MVDYPDNTNDSGLKKTEYSKIYIENNKARDLENGHGKEIKSSQLRANSVEADHPKIMTRKAPSPPTANNTWSGRQNQRRPTINSDTFTSIFNRNSPTRRSVNYDQNGHRLSQSANTSPTKTKLRQEIIMLTADEDDGQILENLQKLINHYSDTPKHRNQKRKDSRTDVGLSKIPMPFAHNI